ncbi:hypothetical protein [Paenirhodobacter enshiensis]|uniref:hypothetical protein n=1 Tax=Paenirhodobacter enshiensis TaxID=1105367 RepID=UPI003FA30044
MNRTIPPEFIIAEVCARHGLRPTDLPAGVLRPELLWPRREAAYLLRLLSPMSLYHACRAVGARPSADILRDLVDPVTVRLSKDPEYRARLQSMVRAIIDAHRDAQGISVLEGARRLMSLDATSPVAGVRSCATTLLAAASILANPDLSDAEARAAALQVIGK